MPDGYPDEFIKFLGTAGSRFVVSTQVRASGGLWVRLAGQNLWIDPGPGALVNAYRSEPRLDAAETDAVLISHKHLDHTNDANVIIEAMTHGGHRPRGKLLAPPDALDGSSPICEYIFNYIGEVVEIHEHGAYEIGDVTVRVAARHDHPDTTYGLLLEGGCETLGYIVDTRYREDLAEAYASADTLIIHTVLEDNPNRRVYHLSAPDAERIIAAAKPRRAILTHFGVRFLEAGPRGIVEDMQQRLGIEVIAAEDGMLVTIGTEAS